MEKGYGIRVSLPGRQSGGEVPTCSLLFASEVHSVLSYGIKGSQIAAPNWAGFAVWQTVLIWLIKALSETDIWHSLYQRPEMPLDKSLSILKKKIETCRDLK